MKIIINKYTPDSPPPCKFASWVEHYNLTIVVNERGPEWTKTSGRFYADFEHGEVMTEGCLASVYGNGSTPEEAIEDYKLKIVGKRLVFNSYTPYRFEVDTPKNGCSNDNKTS